MSDWTMSEAVRRYGFIMDRLGLPGEEVQGLHALTAEAGEPDVDALVDADDPVSTAEEAVEGGETARDAIAGTATTTPADSTVDDLDSLFEDLDESTLDAAGQRDDGDAGTERSSADARGGESEALPGHAADIAALAATASVDWGVDDAYAGAFEDALDADELDDVFAALERDAAMSGFRVRRRPTTTR